MTQAMQMAEGFASTHKCRLMSWAQPAKSLTDKSCHIPARDGAGLLLQLLQQLGREFFSSGDDHAAILSARAAVSSEKDVYHAHGFSRREVRFERDFKSLPVHVVSRVPPPEGGTPNGRYSDSTS